MRRWQLTALSLALLFPAAARPAAVKPEGLWLDVPYVRQPPQGCGAASIAMILRYWTLKDPLYKCSLPSVRAIQRALYSPAAQGIYAKDMERYLRGKGMRVIAFEGDWNLLREHLAKGRPLIVCLREGRWLHYVVVVGLDPAKNAVLVNDPAGQRLEPLRRKAFETKWRAEGNWTLLALPEPSR